MVSMTTGHPHGVLVLDGQPLSLDQVSQVAAGSMGVAIASGARSRIAASQSVVERIVTSDETAYGINTGFGKLSDVRIGSEDLQRLKMALIWPESPHKQNVSPVVAVLSRDHGIQRGTAEVLYAMNRRHHAATLRRDSEPHERSVGADDAAESLKTEDNEAEWGFTR